MIRRLKKLTLVKGNEIIVAQTAEIMNDLINDKSELKEFENKLKDDLTIDLLAQFSEALRKKYKITINDDVIDQLNKMNIEKPDLKLFDKNYVSGKNQILFHSFSADIHSVSILIQLQKKIYFFV